MSRRFDADLRCGRRWLILLILALAPSLIGQLKAVTLDELMNNPKLTPKRFANYFENFVYEYHEEVQPPEIFLATERGDCDDYAILADTVLAHHRYETRLVHVRLAGLVAHDVCYVTQDKVYLDYNNRAYFRTLLRCGPSLREIATKVADSFNANWTSVSEYTYDGHAKHMVATVVKTDPPSSDPVPGKARPNGIKIDF